MINNASRWTRCHVAMFGLFMFAFVFVHQRHFDDPTPVSRLNLLNALVRDGTFEIDRYHENTPDKAFFRNHYFSDKAPGTVVISLVPFMASTAILRWMELDLDSKSAWLIGSWICCACGLAPITSLGAIAMFHWLRGYVGARVAWMTTVAVFLGAAPLPYSTMMFSHATVVGLLCVAIWAINRLQTLKNGPRLRGEIPPVAMKNHEEGVGGIVGGALRNGLHLRWIAGFCLGLALASEFTAGLVVMALLIWAGGKSLRGWGQLLTGGMAPLALIPFYNAVTMGDPLTLPYSHQAVFQEMQEGLYAIEWPDLGTAYQLLFGATRGLFYWSPFLWMTCLGWWIGLRRNGLRWTGLFYLLPVLQIVIISGRVWDWQAGFVLGPRYLAPILPLLALPCAIGIRKCQKLGLILTAISIAMTVLATATDACPRYDVTHPLFQLHLPALFRCDFNFFLSDMFGWMRLMSFLVYVITVSILGLWIWKHVQRLESIHDGFSSDDAMF